MKTKNLFNIVLVASVTFCACSTVKLTVSGNPAAIRQVPKIAILETLFSAPELPLFPLIDAGVYKNRVRKISPKIVAEHEKHIEGFEQALAQALTNESGNQVLHGNALRSSQEYQQLSSSGIPMYSFAFDNDLVPEAIAPKGTMNFFDFKDVSTLAGYFDSSDEGVAQTMAKIATVLDVDSVVVAVGTVVTTSVGPFGVDGHRLLKVRVYVYNRKGQLVLHGLSTTEATTGDPDDITHHVSQLSHLAKEVNRLVPALSGKGTPQ